MALIIFSLIFLVGTLIFITFDGVKKDDDWIVLKMFLVAICITCFFAVGSESGLLEGRKHGQKDALKGKFDYEMKILYEEENGEFIPVDTLFLKL